MLDYNMRVRYLFIMFAAQQLRVYTIYMHERKPELDRVSQENKRENEYVG